MTVTLLFDLDDTLIGNGIETFLPAYFKALSNFLSPFLERPDILIPALLESTSHMAKNQRPDCTLKEAFEARFYPALQTNVHTLQPLIERFYTEIFPSLQRLTTPRPEAVQVVESAFARGYQIAIATNPLFPRTAILQRLAWAGLPAEDYPFQAITSYENYHFAKPNPAFYAEILANLAWPEGTVVMVGDDFKRDILPARQLGLAAYWLNQDGEIPPGVDEKPTATGRLEDLLSWLDDIPEEQLLPDFNSPAAMEATLRSTPACLNSLCRALSIPQWTSRPRPDEWCPTEILCHLRDVESEVNLPRLTKVLQEDNPFLPGKDTDPWAEERQYIRQNGPQALRQFTSARLQTLDLLVEAAPDDWKRTARHAILGPTQLSELVSIIAAHDRLHVQQICRNLAVLS